MEQLKVGDRVSIRSEDEFNKALGTIIKVDGSDIPYLVALDLEGQAENPQWFQAKEVILEVAKTNTPLTPTGLKQALNDAFPKGHPRYNEVTLEEMQLHSDKNHDYAAGGDPLGNFRRVGNFLAQYPGLSLADPSVYAMILAMKQIDAFFWMKSNGHTAKVEGVGRRLVDVTVYSKLARIIDEEQALHLSEVQAAVPAQ